MKYQLKTLGSYISGTVEFMLVELNTLGNPGLSMVSLRERSDTPEANFVLVTCSHVLAIEFVAMLFTVFLSSVVLSPRAWESFSNALLWKFV